MTGEDLKMQGILDVADHKKKTFKTNRPYVYERKADGKLRRRCTTLDEAAPHFWEFVDRKGEEECWPWRSVLSHEGYGQFWLSGRKVAHRIAYQLFYGKEPGRLNVCHKCDNPTCCNPQHLFLGTQSDNIIDCARKGRFNQGTKHHSHKLIPQQVIEIRRLHATGLNYVMLGKMFGVTDSSIAAIIKGRSWKYLK